MALLAADTPAEIEHVQIALLRRMPPWRKMALVGEMTRTVRELALEGLRHRHPNESPAQIRRRLADLMLGPELAVRVYGPLEGDDEC
jgi:hypothetical protein